MLKDYNVKGGFFMSLSDLCQPNIVFILTDDQRWDTLGCAGNPIIQTPHLDEIARQGIRFSNMFATSPVCAASRASIFTGLYERTHGFTFKTPPLASCYTDISYPKLLKEAGYQTGFVGKFGIRTGEDNIRNMFDHFVPLNRNPYFKKQPDGTEKHLTDIEGENAIAFLDTITKEKPFCLSVSFNAPHAEDDDPQQYFWQKEMDELYKDVTIPVPETMDDEFFNRHPEFLKQSLSRVRFNWRFDDPQKYQEMVKGYYRMISGVDMVVGRICQALEARGLADNTIIIFTSDNGYFLGERGFADKWYLYEYSLRVPLLIFDPRVPKERRGVIVKQTALNVDMAPTILNLAGVDVPDSMQGSSLVPLLNGETQLDWREEFYAEHLFNNPQIPKSEGIRTERYTLIDWFEHNYKELYDHHIDFDQIKNLVNDPHYTQILERLEKRTEQFRKMYIKDKQYERNER